MQERISLQELIAYNNTPKAKALIIKYGYEPARSYKDLMTKLFRLTKEYREEGLIELAKLHPHKDLILTYNMPVPKMETETKSRNTRNRFSNFEYAEEYIDFIGSKKSGTEKSDNKIDLNSLNQYLPLIIVSGIFALAITNFKN